MSRTVYVCPKCNEESLWAFDYEGIEVDFCDTCKGIWLDEGELASYVELSKDIPDLETAMETARETEMPCPKCSGFLHELEYAEGAGIFIDRCNTCNGIFLDAGEISDIETLSATLEHPFARVFAVVQEARKKGYKIL